MHAEEETTDQASLLKDWYARYHAPLTRFLQSCFGSGPPYPDDIAQSVFARLIDQPTLSQVANPKAFLWQAGRNLAISELRAMDTAERNGVELKTRLFDLEGYLLGPERVFESRERLQLVADVLEKMPKRRRAVLIMVRVDGLSQTEVARRLNITSPAVSRHLGKATAELYDALT